MLPIGGIEDLETAKSTLYISIYRIQIFKSSF
jgi:hypothetical protein